jgi:hypothetical protein
MKDVLQNAFHSGLHSRQEPTRARRRKSIRSSDPGRTDRRQFPQNRSSLSVLRAHQFGRAQANRERLRAIANSGRRLWRFRRGETHVRLKSVYTCRGRLRRMAAAWSVDHRRSGRDMKAGVDDVALAAAFRGSQLNVEKLLAGFRRRNYFGMPACWPTSRQRVRRMILRSARCQWAFTRNPAAVSQADRR